ncbi:unnamed protein product [Closterium sp. Yama58-4]|nr:unnamed protein product [Closterium sp. Yama58-4]
MPCQPQPAPSSKYLVFAYSDEQLSNSRSHLVEAARIAHATNRILVLPKGSRSHLSVALGLPFCTYFHLAHFDSAAWVSPDLFLLMARAALSAPSVAFMLLQSSYMRKHPFMHQPVAAMLGELAAYGMGHVPNGGNTVDVAMPAASDSVLARLHAWQHKQVVVWVKDTWERIAFEPQTDLMSFHMLPYSRPWHAMAHAVMAHLPARFIAVHFRSEFIAFRLAQRLKRDGRRANASMLEEMMAWCVRAARDLIEQVQQDTHTTAVFIAADVPFTARPGTPQLGGKQSAGEQGGGEPGGEEQGGGGRRGGEQGGGGQGGGEGEVVRSDSWSETTWSFGDGERVRAAPRDSLRWLRESVEGTVMLDEVLPQVNQYDPGIVAIIDKLVCAHAHVFLAGSIPCGGGRGFEQDLNNHRWQLNHPRSSLKRWVTDATAYINSRE